MSSHTLNFGVLLVPQFQWLDAAGPIDYLNNHSRRYISYLPGVPKEVLDHACDIEWHYISTDLAPVYATSGPAQLPTCTYADCPPLDYLIVPGPVTADLTEALPEASIPFLLKLVVHPEFKAILLVCTASVAVAKSGILDGLRVCSNKVAMRGLAGAGMLNKNVKWIGDKRWIVDGKVWSSAGVTSGIDLAAEFARVHFDPAIVALVKDATEYEPKPAQPDPFARLLDGIALP